MRWRSRRSACSALLVAVAVIAPGCGGDSTVAPPAPAPSVGVTGVATKEQGAPAAGAVVWLEAAHAARPARVDRLRVVASDPARAKAGRAAAGSTDELRSTIADGNGRFAFANVAAGDYILTCRLPDHLAATTAVHVHEAGAAADTVFVQVRLAPSGRFGGRASLEGATSHNGTVVYLQGTSTVAITDPSGEYAMRDVPLGTWTVVATRAGYIDASTPATLSAAGDSVRVPDLVLPRDLNQAPVASISVSGLCHGYPSELSPAGSHDDGTIVRYEWSFENDGRIDSTTSQPIPILHSYSAGDHRAKLIVTDDHGTIGISTAPFSVITPDSVFVSAATGTPGGTGSRNSPVSTISTALALLNNGPSPCVRVLMIAAGDYPEELVIREGPVRVIRGGLDAVTWTRAAGQYSVVHHASNTANASGFLDVNVTGMMFRGDWHGASTSAIAFAADQCSGLRFEDCRFVASPGQVGTAGEAGAPGKNGDPGGPGSFDGTGGNGACGPCGTHHQACGGQGGSGTLGDGGRGGDVGGLFCVSDPPAHGGAGGQVAPACGNGSPGMAGDRGQDGENGAGGSGLTSSGEIVEQSVLQLTWSPYRGAYGLSLGGLGFPGGGGGAGGGNACTFAAPGGGGGGGGAGGQGGGNGPGGFSGGGSIAILLYNASPQFVDCSIEAGDGGAGGRGGVGGEGGGGGAGGAGGQGRNGGALGGNGGAGGKGGGGGGGQGGAGGPSWCVAKNPASSPLFTGCKLTFGAGGVGGDGGLNGAGLPSGARGPDGPAGNFGP